jgi:hypothetical protein
MTNRHIARRTLLTRTGFGVGAAFGAGLSTNFGAGLGSGLATAQARAAAGDNVLSEAHWADKSGVRLAIYRKRLGKLAGAADRPPPVLFLVHGSSLSALSSFDLNVPGADYSMMNAFVGYGFDVWTMDHENYGRSSQTSSNSDIAQRGRRSQGGDGCRARQDRPA